MAVLLPWRPRKPTPTRRMPSSARAAAFPALPIGSYAGRARFCPSPQAVLAPELERAVGQIVEVGLAGIAGDDEPFAGQALYLEWRRDDLLSGYLIPEQDLEFLS